MAFRRFVDSFKLEPAPVPVVAMASNDASAVAFGDDKKSIGHSSTEGVAALSHDAQAVRIDLEKEGVLATTADGTRIASDESGLKRNLTSRHMQMISLGGSIGTGLFIGSGGVLATSGPGYLLVGYGLVGTMLACVVMSLGELATIFPVSGSFASYATRFIAPSWGFAMGWNYWMQWWIALPLELVAATIVIDYWDVNGSITPGVWIIVFLVAISIINMFGVRGYGEIEFGAALVKIFAIVIFSIVGIVITAGGAPNREAFGTRFWHTEAGSFFNGFQGFCSIFVAAAFAFSGTELIGLAAAETGNPRKEVPKAAKQIFFRVLLFYVIALFIVTLCVDPTDPRLNGSSSYDARASPFVIAIQNGMINGLPSVMNAVILVSVLSVGNSSVYASSRTLLGLAQAGQAPRIFSYIDREGRPLPAVGFSLIFGLLAFLIYSADQSTVFNWLLALSGLATIFSWGSITYSYVRFRAAWKRAGHTVEEIPWSSPLGVIGAWYGTIFCALVLVFQLIIAAWPIESPDSLMNAQERATNFFELYLAAPFCLLFLLVGEINWSGLFGKSDRRGFWKRSWVAIDQIDIQTGRRDPVPVEVLRREREELRARPIWLKIWQFFF